MLNTALWIAQTFVAVVFALAGATKLSLPRERLAKRMHWAEAWPRGRIRLLGFAEVAGSVGLVVPAVTGIAPVLTPIAAACLCVLMVGAARTHRQLGEGFVPAAVIGALCVAIAVGRVATSHAANGAAVVVPSAARAGQPR
jgi:hypothetical protein